MTNVFALDLATRTGFAWGPVTEDHGALFRSKCSAPPHSGSIRFTRSGPGFFSEAYDWFNAKLDVYPTDTFIYEAPVLPKKKANIVTTRRLQGLCAVAELVGFQRCDRVFEAKPSTIKKHATGYGQAKKEAMMKAARQMGWEVENDDHADALWLHHYACFRIHVSRQRAVNQ